MPNNKDESNSSRADFSYRILPHYEAVARLAELETRDYHPLEQLNEFSLMVRLTDDFLVALSQTFQNFASRQLQWKSLKIRTVEYTLFDPTLLYEVLKIANEASLFEKTDLNIDWHESYRDNNDSSVEIQLLPSLEQNHRLLELKLWSNLDFSHADIQSLSRTLQETTTLTDLNVAFANGDHLNVVFANGDHLHLWDALALNQTLETIEFNNVQHPQAVLEISRALAGHEKLKKLKLGATGSESDFSKAIQMLLTSETCQLDSLFLHHTGSDRQFHLNTDRLVEALKDNRSLKQYATVFLNLSGERPFSTLLGAVQSHPSLNSIDFSTCQLFSVEDIQAATELEPLPRRVTLQMGNENYRKQQQQQALKIFLDTHPEVSVYETFDRHFSHTQSRYANHLNRCGRYLMRHHLGGNIPLGLWALVLEKINKKKYRLRMEAETLGKFKPSVLFEFLRGPALAGRETQTPTYAG